MPGQLASSTANIYPSSPKIISIEILNNVHLRKYFLSSQIYCKLNFSVKVQNRIALGRKLCQRD